MRKPRCDRNAEPPPADPMGGASCQSCMYWKEQTEERDEYRWGKCRRNPPVPVLTVDEETGEQDGASAWPLTEPEDLCGEFRGGQ